jgi:hypothetical protein
MDRAKILPVPKKYLAFKRLPCENEVNIMKYREVEQVQDAGCL